MGPILTEVPPINRNLSYWYVGVGISYNISSLYKTNISTATGASLSLLPQDNSAGNFVKVRQRVPVRIEFTSANSQDAMSRLRAGMNVECSVKY